MNFFTQVDAPLLSDGYASVPLQDGYLLRIEALEAWCLRISLLPPDGLRIDRSWMIAPGDAAPWEGRPRLDRAGFACPALQFGAAATVLENEDFRIDIRSSPLALTVEARGYNGWQTVLADRPTGAYALARGGRQARHYQCRSRTMYHYGLGDKSGPLDRTNRRFRFLQLDALGYDAELSDPLYKHAPFLMVDEPDGAGAVGLLYDTLSEITFDLGAEHSNYHPLYRYVEAEEPALVYYVLAGPRVRDIVPRLHALTGRSYFPPRWSLGFAFTSMHHADHPNAQQVIGDFAERCRRDEIPISAIHFGSGYSRGADGKRYVFTWNEQTFPHRAALFARLRELGFYTAANVKPTLLTTHPAYADVAAAGYFIRREDGPPAVEPFWGGLGSTLDFTNPAAAQWWQEHATRQVLEAGFDALWNDNNEAEIANERAWLHGFDGRLPALDLRPLHALLMTRASVEATQAHAPERRHFSITRAGPIGLQRYAETWSGDNWTSWHTLKWNLRNGLAMSLSGMPLVGHDVGGFVGPRAEPELFVRWMQMMALHPRCVMNGWKPEPDGGPNLPWMHPEATDLLRSALRLRYRFLPLLYTLVQRAHRWGEPIITPLFYHFDDPACRREIDAFMLGPDLLAAPVVEQGADAVRIYLPVVPGGWHDFATGVRYPGGTTITIPAPLARLPLLVRAGAVLPLATAWPVHAPHDPTHIELTAFAGAPLQSSRPALYWDDGLTVVSPAAMVAVTARPAGAEPGLDIAIDGDAAVLPRLSTRIIYGDER